ncbi:ribonuclease T2 family protein [Photobacterium sanctipauli]|uniref:ribonuclease T2 family protein n=1 Tax=Photobacterium sanctipauli TaxID=1342794 RepID=UPI001304A287|nr:ribonuclease [Photobacterium sanctipauli]
MLFVNVILFSNFSQAATKLDGTFIATEQCPAYQSIKKKTNPGKITTKIDASYQTLAINKPDGDWLQLRFENASPSVRWVNINCGHLNSTSAIATRNANQSSCSIANQQDSYVLAVSWQPGFCEHANFKGNKPECTALDDGKIAINHLTLHGLWPNKKSCGINYGYCQPYKAMKLSDDTVASIAQWMPNFHFQTDFGSYQWKKHGSCQHRSDDEYFITATKLVEQADASPIGTYIKQRIGQSITVDDFKRYLTSQLGSKAAKRIQLSCAKGKYLQEVRIQLPRDFEQYPSFSEKLNAAPLARSFKGNCHSRIHVED